MNEKEIRLDQTEKVLRCLRTIFETRGSYRELIQMLNFDEEAYNQLADEGLELIKYSLRHKPHFWLPRETSTGEKPLCDNCRRFDKCGRSQWICGEWEEDFGEKQMTLF